MEQPIMKQPRSEPRARARHERRSLAEFTAPALGSAATLPPPPTPRLATIGPESANGQAFQEEKSDLGSSAGSEELAGQDLSMCHPTPVEHHASDVTAGSGAVTARSTENGSSGDGLPDEVRAAVEAAEDYRSSMLDDMRISLKATLEYANGLASIHSPVGVMARSINNSRELSTSLSVGLGDIPTMALAAEDYRTKAFDLMKTNINATMEFAQRLATARSPGEFVELTTSHARSQMETAFTQTSELVQLAQKLAKSNLEQIAARFTKALGGRKE
jgi:hypothetical protein